MVMLIFSFNYTSLLKIRLAVLNVLLTMKEDSTRCPHVNALQLTFPLSFCSQNINTFENRMLMLDGMPSVRVKTELLESEQGVSFQWCPTLFSL